RVVEQLERLLGEPALVGKRESQHGPLRAEERMGANENARSVFRTGSGRPASVCRGLGTPRRTQARSPARRAVDVMHMMPAEGSHEGEEITKPPAARQAGRRAGGVIPARRAPPPSPPCPRGGRSRR